MVTYYSDISASRIIEFLGDCRRNGIPKDVAVSIHGKEKARRISRGTMSNQTSNYYLAAFKHFCRWMVADRRATVSPVVHLDGVNADLDRRHKRRNLSADELVRLLKATASSPVRFKLDGLSRALLYRVAMETGFRRNELKALTVDCLDLDAETPTLSLPLKATKNRKGAAQPIRRELADELRTWLESRDVAPDAKLWPTVTRKTRPE